MKSDSLSGPHFCSLEFGGALHPVGVEISVKFNLKVKAKFSTWLVAGHGPSMRDCLADGLIHVLRLSS